MSTPRSSSRRRSTRIELSDEVNGATVRRSSSTRRPRSHSTKKTRHAEGETVSSANSAKKKSSRRSSNSRKSNNNDTEQSPTSSPSNDDVTTPSTRRRVTRSSSAKKRRDDEVDYLTTPKKKSNTQQDGEDWTTVSPSLLYRTNAALDAVKQSCTRYQLLAFDHCPAWLKDNRYIRSGYRANIGWRQSVESVCHLHNETVNVWSHLIAFLVMTCLLFATMMILSPHGVDRLDLDVVLSSRPICDGPERNPRCDLQGALSNALPNSADPNSSAAAAAAAGSSSEEPLELLHQILGDDQDEMLIELLSRVQTHVPNLQHLTQTLKEKASSIQASIYAAVPEDASRQLKQLKDETSLTFSEYVHQMDDKLTELKLSISKLMSESVEEKAAVATQRVQEEYGKLKETLSELSKAFSTDFTSPRNLDVIRSTEQFLATFFDQTHFRDGFNLSPTLIAMPNVKVKVKSVTAAGMPLGTGSIFGKGLEDALDDLSPSRAGHSTELDLLAATQQNHETKLDADGNGMTTSTSIGYMGIEAHTSKSQPGLVRLQLHSYLPRYPLAIFLVTAMLCLFFSSVYHLMHAVSDVWARRFQALDYAGIVLLIAGSTHPVIYYGFFCSPLLKWSYIGVVWTLALIVFTIVVLPAYREMKYRGLKVFCFICLGFSGCVPLMHLNLLLGEIHFIFYWLCVMGFCYLTGAAIYLFQVPERWWPGHFDYFFSSHQLWHVSIFAAVLVHYFGLMHHFEWRMTRVCTPDMWS